VREPADARAPERRRGPGVELRARDPLHAYPAVALVVVVVVVFFFGFFSLLFLGRRAVRGDDAYLPELDVDGVLLLLLLLLLLRAQPRRRRRRARADDPACTCSSSPAEYSPFNEVSWISSLATVVPLATIYTRASTNPRSRTSKPTSVRGAEKK
jgi:hypothetical protein